jgi:hypothetical protein
MNNPVAPFDAHKASLRRTAVITAILAAFLIPFMSYSILLVERRRQLTFSRLDSPSSPSSSPCRLAWDVDRLPLTRDDSPLFTTLLRTVDFDH